MTLLIGQNAFAQTDNSKVYSNNDFYFYYAVAGLGSNLGSFQPTLTVYNNQFIYTKEQNSYWGKRSRKKQFISKGTLQESSIDSILAIVHGLKDSTIYRTNPCIMSGAIIYLTIAHVTDTTKFTLHNTFDTTALKIIDILNPYLPKDKKLCCSAKKIKEEEDCWTYLRNKVALQSKDSSNIKQ